MTSADESEGHDALFCEGECQCWLHRWCAGVSRKKFQQLTVSAEPFLCPACVSQKQQAVIEGLQGNIQALTAEVLELKATVERFQLQSDWSSVSIQTAWKLEPVLEFQISPPASLPMPTLPVAQSGPDQAGPTSGAAVGSQSQTETGPEVNGSLAH